MPLIGTYHGVLTPIIVITWFRRALPVLDAELSTNVGLRRILPPPEGLARHNDISYPLFLHSYIGQRIPGGR